MYNIARNQSKFNILLAVSLLALAFILSQPDKALAQVSGSGTIGQIPKWTATSTLGNSVITELPSGYIGIGTITPESVFHVVGSGASIFSRTVTGSIGTPQSAMQLGFNGGTMQVGAGPSMLFFSDITGATPSKQFMGRVTAIWENPTAGSEAAGLAFNVRASAGDTNAQTEAMRVTSTGRVGIGTSTPVEHLQIGTGGSNYNFSIATSSNNKGFIGTFNDVVTLGINRRLTDGLFSDIGKTHAEIEVFSGNADSKIVFLTASANNTLASERMRIDKSGNIGIGTMTPTSKLDVVGNTNVTGNITASGNVGIGTSTPAAKLDVAGNTNMTGNLTVVGTGNVGIGTTAPTAKLHVIGTATISGALNSGTLSVTGDITATGNIAAKYQDVAEWVPTRQALPVGTVVVLDSELSNHVIFSSKAYDTKVAGVISEKPGLILGEGGEGKVMVATTGRVRIKVDASKAPIRVGDLLVTSNEEGVAMRSEPLDLAGTKIHRPGTIIGKALEPLAKGKGEILVLLSMQ